MELKLDLGLGIQIVYYIVRWSLELLFWDWREMGQERGRSYKRVDKEEMGTLKKNFASFESVHCDDRMKEEVSP